MTKPQHASTPKHPLAEVFGFPAHDMSARACRYRKNRLCPFNNRVPNCTKDKAQSPLGVCSIFHGGDAVITCPVRFRQDWRVADDAAGFFFDDGAKWTTLTEVRLRDGDGGSAGNIDLVFCEYDDSGRIRDFGALEIQAVYISGNVRAPFDEYMSSPRSRCGMDWTNEAHYPRADYLSSSRKRLAPQLIFKGGILHSWGKRMAVALNSGFFDTLPPLPEVPRDSADIAWFVYDVCPHGNLGIPWQLNLVRIVYTQFDAALSRITKPRIGSVSDFLALLQKKLDVKLSTPPSNRTIDKPF